MDGLYPFVKNTMPFSILPAVLCGALPSPSFQPHIPDKSPRYFSYLLSSPSDPRVPPGLSYHLGEIWLKELEKVTAVVTATKPVPMKLVLAPFLTLVAKTPNKATCQQIQASLIDPLLSALSPPTSSDESPPPKRSKPGSPQDNLPNLLANSCLSPQDEPSNRRQLWKGVLEYIFEVASQGDSRDSNRKRLYAICNANIDEGDNV